MKTVNKGDNFMNLVKAEGAYSPQNYVYAVTGKCYIFHEYNIGEMIDGIHNCLARNGYDLWDYPLTEIDHIVENKINVVLVELTGEDDNGEWKTIYRWFEVPAQFPIEDEDCK